MPPADQNENNNGNNLPSHNPNQVPPQSNPNVVGLPPENNPQGLPNAYAQNVQPISANSGGVSGNSKQKIVLFAVVGALVLVGLVVGIIAMTSKKSPSANNSGSEISTNDVDDSLDSKSEDATPAELVRTPINKSTVTDYGYGIEINEMITGYQPKNPESKADVIIFKVTLTEQQKPQYTGTSPAAINFATLVDGTEYERTTLYAGASQKELNEAGYPTLDGMRPTAGGPVSGYITFGIPKGSKPTLVRYKQKEAKLINNGSTIPAKNYDITL